MVRLHAVQTERKEAIWHHLEAELTPLSKYESCFSENQGKG
jgi:hypothetical protein